MTYNIQQLIIESKAYATKLQGKVGSILYDLLINHRAPLRPTIEYFELEKRNVILLTGIVPTKFNNSDFRIPIKMWISSKFPFYPPYVYLTPTSIMKIASNHPNCNKDGRVQTPYLNQWNINTSNLWDLFKELSVLFSAKTPVYAIGRPNQHAINAQHNQHSTNTQPIRKPPSQHSYQSDITDDKALLIAKLLSIYEDALSTPNGELKLRQQQYNTDIDKLHKIKASIKQIEDLEGKVNEQKNKLDETVNKLEGTVKRAAKRLREFDEKNVEDLEIIKKPNTRELIEIDSQIAAMKIYS
eukprot:CAMPEP_0117424566 /NCGR_PEP_ID=MMETSP0758-20121206/4955_1 /TAXON_ID=63605 /ORGANISM="Percolomonas cosmopolitus, Strain AE-1 (ATCC 50343)" /LENGTH=298 /DNA_ID=CAMNT_0005208413 /DNA_START=124 /DNA_END=1021 /DNA_ORIENTATION=-